jgi:hypothetical protein
MKNTIYFKFGTYGSHKHPCIWIENGSGTSKYILTYDYEDAFKTMQTEIEQYLKHGWKVEWITD